MERDGSTGFAVVVDDFERPTDWNNEENVCIKARGALFYIDHDTLEIVLSTRLYFLQNRYLSGDFDGGRQSFHRWVMNCPKGLLVDHINGNGRDNRRCNLRVGDASHNNSNRQRISKEELRGVKQARLQWQASISKDRVKHYIGLFKTKEEAARAYDQRAIELFGEFALTNFPREDYGSITPKDVSDFTCRVPRPANREHEKCNLCEKPSVGDSGLCKGHLKTAEERNKKAELGLEVRVYRPRLKEKPTCCYIDGCPDKLFVADRCYKHDRLLRISEGYKGNEDMPRTLYGNI